MWQVIIWIDNGLAPNSRRAIIFKQIDLFYRHKCASLSLGELSFKRGHAQSVFFVVPGITLKMVICAF